MSIRKPGSIAAVAPLEDCDRTLQHGRRLSLAVAGDEDLIEIRGRGGAVELRIRLTPDGPVLQLESVCLSLKAAQAVELECASFKVHAKEALELCSEGSLRIHAKEDLELDAAGDVCVTGTLIHLN